MNHPQPVSRRTTYTLLGLKEEEHNGADSIPIGRFIKRHQRHVVGQDAPDKGAKGRGAAVREAHDRSVGRAHCQLS